MAGHLKRNLMVGLAAGAAGTLAMNGYFALLARLNPESVHGRGEEPATVKVARRALRRAGVKSPSSRTRNVGGEVVNWGYGTTWGAIAGLSHAAGAPLDLGWGLPFGAALWAGGDLWMTYKLRLARHPREYPTSVHAGALGAHLVYGSAVWATMHLLGPAHKQRAPRAIRHAA